MANNYTTSVGSIVKLRADGFFDSPIEIEAMPSDDMWDGPDVTTGEVARGHDGTLAVAYIYPSNEFSFSVMASSPSIPLLSEMIEREGSRREKFLINLTVFVKGTGVTYTMTDGYLITHPPLPKAGATLQPMKYGFNFKKITFARG